MNKYIMTVSCRTKEAKQYTEIDRDLNTLLEMFYTDQKLKRYNMNVVDITLSACSLTSGGTHHTLLLTYLIKYEASQDLSQVIGKVGVFERPDR